MRSVVAPLWAAPSLASGRTAGGGITVDSEEGTGTTFHVFLPSSRASEWVSAVKPPLTASGHGDIVLVVDDRPAALELTVRILRHSGYQTLEASTSDQALPWCPHATSGS